MGKIYKVEWKCDRPSCGVTEISEHTHTMPEGWSSVTMSVNEENEECTCDCHDYDLDDEEREADHDEDNCGCPDDDGERTSFFCKSCTAEIKSKFFDKDTARKIVAGGGLL